MNQLIKPTAKLLQRNVIRAICVASLFGGDLLAQENPPLSKTDFKTPPESARPRTWWHWTGSNISKEGITKDLEWMKRVGLGGMQLADVASGSGQVVERKTLFFSPEWFDAVRHTANEAERLGLEMSMFSSAGWSLTGGPWVKPEEAMKKLVWSEMNVTGGTTFKGKLPAPPNAIGAFRNIGSTVNAFYADQAVIAFRTPAGENAGDNVPVVTSNTGAVDPKALFDDDLNSVASVTTGGKPGTVWIQFTYAKPFAARALSIASRRGIPFGRLMASEDGKTYRDLAEFPGKSGYRGSSARTYAFPETKARYFKVELTAVPFNPAGVISQATTLPDSTYQLSELKLFSGSRVNRWEDKAGYNFMFEYDNVATPQANDGGAIAKDGIVDLTSKMAADGTLTWDAPSGEWTIMRFGYSLTGAKNRPAVPSGLGYEADKLSKKHTESYLKGYTGPLMKELGALYGKRLQYLMLDSWEAGIQNWTDEMIAEFKKRRGYDPTPFLPVMAGRVVQNAEVSDRFLWDFRRTLVDMFAENHYGTITEFLHKQGLKTYAEAGGVSLETIEDALLNKKYVDIPMGEFWTKDLHPSSMYYQDVRGAASAGHIYGKNIVAAESFTGGNYDSPFTLKKNADYWFTQGLNRLVFHTSAHQPLDTKPGNTMVGTHFNRNITWAELGAPFITYLSRNSYMLQKGRYVADVAYMLNEGAPSTMPFWGAGMQPALPDGFQFDYVNADVVVNRMSVNSAGKIALPDGMTYSVLVLPQTLQMTIPVLRKVKELVAGGVTLVGPKPVAAPGLTNYPASEDELHSLAAEIWGDLDGVSRTTRTYGKGRVLWGMPLSSAVTYANLVPDLEFSKPLDGDLAWIHRQDGENDIYFLVNRSDKPQDIDVRFRVSGKGAELWHPDNGDTETATTIPSGNKTIVPLHFEGNETVFVVFNKNVAAKTTIAAKKVYTTLQDLDGPWEVKFPEKMGAPATLALTSLAPLSASTDDGVKYFSGTASYTKTFEVKKMPAAGSRVYLDLGKVGDIAEVTLNGKSLDLLWKVPYRTDITSALVKGKNQLTVKVTNEWTNRLIGDKAAPDKKVLSVYTNPFGGAYTLLESGLIGPVKLVTQ